MNEAVAATLSEQVPSQSSGSAVDNRPESVSLPGVSLPRRLSLPALPSEESSEVQEPRDFAEKRPSIQIFPPLKLNRPASQWSRPHLVKPEEFRASLIATAQALASQVTPSPQQVSNGSSSSVRSKSRRSSVGSRNALVDALVHASEEQMVEPSIPVSVPPLPEESTATSPPVLPPKAFPTEEDPSMNSAMRMIAAVERIAADRVESVLRGKVSTSESDTSEKYRQMKLVFRDVVLSALTNSRLIREELASIKQDLKQHSPGPRIIAESSKHSPRQLSPKPVLAAKLVVSPPIIINAIPSAVSSAVPSGVPYAVSSSVSESHPDSAQSVASVPVARTIKYSPRHISVMCARLLLAPSVLSPSDMEKLLSSAAGGRGRETVRLSTGQSTVNPKAFVVVVIQESLTVDEWVNRLKGCRLIESYDANFPLNLSFQHGHPWEVRIRSDMATITPRWSPIADLSNSYS